MWKFLEYLAIALAFILFFCLVLFLVVYLPLFIVGGVGGVVLCGVLIWITTALVFFIDQEII